MHRDEKTKHRSHFLQNWADALKRRCIESIVLLCLLSAVSAFTSATLVLKASRVAFYRAPIRRFSFTAPGTSSSWCRPDHVFAAYRHKAGQANHLAPPKHHVFRLRAASPLEEPSIDITSCLEVIEIATQPHQAIEGFAFRVVTDRIAGNLYVAVKKKPIAIQHIE